MRIHDLIKARSLIFICFCFMAISCVPVVSIKYYIKLEDSITKPGSNLSVEEIPRLQEVIDKVAIKYEMDLYKVIKNENYKQLIYIYSYMIESSNKELILSVFEDYKEGKIEIEISDAYCDTRSQRSKDLEFDLVDQIRKQYGETIIVKEN